jgi:hypothetical protein
MPSPTAPNPGGPPSFPPDPEPAAEFSATTRIIVFGVLIAIFGGIAAFVIVKVLNPPAPAYSAGDCVRVVEGGRFDAEVEQVDCAQDGALYEVGVYLEDPDQSCPAESYSSYQQTGGRQQEYKLCLVLNAEEGDCLDVPTIALGQEKQVACTSDEANRKVTRVVEGTADESACDPEYVDEARVYPQPERTVCLGPVDA